MVWLPAGVTMAGPRISKRRPSGKHQSPSITSAMARIGISSTRPARGRDKGDRIPAMAFPLSRPNASAGDWTRSGSASEQHPVSVGHLAAIDPQIVGIGVVPDHRMISQLAARQGLALIIIGEAALERDRSLIAGARIAPGPGGADWNRLVFQQWLHRLGHLGEILARERQPRGPKGVHSAGMSSRNAEGHPPDQHEQAYSATHGYPPSVPATPRWL